MKINEQKFSEQPDYYAKLQALKELQRKQGTM
jgi:hypothetical protein